MRRAYAMLGLGTAVLLSVASLTFVPKSSKASSTAAPVGEETFLVPAHDGYGVAECLVSGHTCGQAVADTWCEAQGYVRADLVRQVAAGGRDRVGSEGGPLRNAPARLASPARSQLIPSPIRRISAAASVPHGMSGTLEVEFFGEPSIGRSE